MHPTLAHHFLVGTSLTCAVGSFVIYIASIRRGGTRPHPFTRIAVSVGLSVAFISIFLGDDNDKNLGSLLLAGTYALLSFVVLTLSKGRSEGTKKPLDWACLTLSLVGFFAMFALGPQIGLILAIGAEAIAYVPTIRKTWQYPDSESRLTYTLSVLAALLNLAAYKFTFSSLFQLYLVGIGTLMIALSFRKKPAEVASQASL